MKKRDLFAELSEGFTALQQEREGKITLRTVQVENKPIPPLSAQEVVGIREQSRAKPNAQAALLIRMMEKFPDMVERVGAV